MQALAIVLLATLGAIAYGVVQDQVTVRVCLEYFTIGHPRVFATEDPTLLALGWGVLATWWAGLGIGILLALAARTGGRAPVPARALVRPICALLCVMAVGAALAGVVGYFLARDGAVRLVGAFAKRVPPDRRVAFLADLWAHNASYGFGFLGGLVLAWQTWRTRARA
jgi:hypothetical protein